MFDRLSDFLWLAPPENREASFSNHCSLNCRAYLSVTRAGSFLLNLLDDAVSVSCLINFRFKAQLNLFIALIPSWLK